MNHRDTLAYVRGVPNVFEKEIQRISSLTGNADETSKAMLKELMIVCKPTSIRSICITFLCI